MLGTHLGDRLRDARVRCVRWRGNKKGHLLAFFDLQYLDGGCDRDHVQDTAGEILGKRRVGVGPSAIGRKYTGDTRIGKSRSRARV
jgi:hypothetical protein